MKICCLTLLFILTANVCCKSAPAVRPKRKPHHVRIYPIDHNQYDDLLKLTQGKSVINEGRLVDGGFTTVSDGFNSFSKDVSSGWSSFLRVVGFTTSTYPEKQVTSKYDGQPLCAIRSTDIAYKSKSQGREHLIDEDLESLDEDKHVINCVVVLNRKPADVDDDDDDSDNNDDHHDHDYNHNHNNNQAPYGSIVYGYPYNLLPYIYIQKQPITVPNQQSEQQNNEPISIETDKFEMEVEDATTNVDKNDEEQTTVSNQKEEVEEEEETDSIKDDQLEKTSGTVDNKSTDKEVSTVRQLSPNNVSAVASNPYGYGQPPYGQQPYIPQPYIPYPEGPYGQPPYGQPPYGQPPYGQPPYGQPIYGQPPYGQPPYGPPIYGQPPYGQPPYRPQPPYGLPSYGPNIPGYPIPYLYGSDENKEQVANDPHLNDDYIEDF